MTTILLLTISNIFMTFAWYGHLKYRNVPLLKVIVISWMIAFFEYCFQVPANRIGSYEFSAAQLKTIQEVITLTVFAFFSVFYLGEKFKWNYLAGFGCMVAGVFFVFHKWGGEKEKDNAGARRAQRFAESSRSAHASVHVPLDRMRVPDDDVLEGSEVK